MRSPGLLRWPLWKTLRLLMCHGWNSCAVTAPLCPLQGADNLPSMGGEAGAHLVAQVCKGRTHLAAQPCKLRFLLLFLVLPRLRGRSGDSGGGGGGRRTLGDNCESTTNLACQRRREHHCGATKHRNAELVMQFPEESFCHILPRAAEDLRKRSTAHGTTVRVARIEASR